MSSHVNLSSLSLAVTLREHANASATRTCKKYIFNCILNDVYMRFSSLKIKHVKSKRRLKVIVVPGKRQFYKIQIRSFPTYPSTSDVSLGAQLWKSHQNQYKRNFEQQQKFHFDQLMAFMFIDKIE